MMKEKKAKLRIEDMILEEFNNKFKPEYLDKQKLDKKSLKQIEGLFNIGEKTTAYACCDEAHAHSYACLHYNNPVSGVVERLINEIKGYQATLKEIHNKIKENI